MTAHARQLSAAQRQYDAMSPPEPDWDADAADEAVIVDLMKLPVFVDEAIGDCCEHLALAFVAGESLDVVVERACRKKAEQELEDYAETYPAPSGPGDEHPRDILLRTWRRYQFNSGTRPSKVLCDAMDADRRAA